MAMEFKEYMIRIFTMNNLDLLNFFLVIVIRQHKEDILLKEIY